MKYSAILLSAIAASGAMAAPQGNRGNGGAATIKLGNNVERMATNIDTLSRFSFVGFGEATFKEVTLTLNAKNDKLRCKANDKDGNPFAVKRQPNTDFTFAKGEKWTFAKQAAVAEVICDAEFEQLSKEEQDKIVVELRVKKDSTDFVPIPITSEGLEADVTDTTTFEYVTLSLGPKAVAENEALRCQILTGTQTINVSRGDNKNKPDFGDGFKGAWKFTAGASRVSKIVCGKKIQGADPGAGATPAEGGSAMPPASGTVPPVVGGNELQGNEPQLQGNEPQPQGNEPQPQGNEPQGYKGYKPQGNEN